MVFRCGWWWDRSLCCVVGFEKHSVELMLLFLWFGLQPSMLLNFEPSLSPTAPPNLILKFKEVSNRTLVNSIIQRVPYKI